MIEGIKERAMGSGSGPKTPLKKVTVRWNDGYLESFVVDEVRFGSDLLWMRLVAGSNRHIPLRQVRWFSTIPESHEGE